MKKIMFSLLVFSFGFFTNAQIPKKETSKKESSKKVESKPNVDALGFPDVSGNFLKGNNSKDAIAKIYPGYNGKNYEFVANEILKEANESFSEEMQNFTAWKKLKDLYAIDKKVSYEVYISMPVSWVMRLDTVLSAEMLNYYRAESKK